MNKILFYIPLIVFATFLSWAKLSFGIAVSPVVFIWPVLFAIGGTLLSKGKFWGALLGMLPGIHMIYMGGKYTGQVFNEKPLGILVLAYYFACGCFIFFKHLKYRREAP